MNQSAAWYARGLFACSAILLLSCGGGGTPAPGKVDPDPVITSFSATPGTIAAGSTAQLSALFEHGSAVVDRGVGPIASGAAVGTGPLSVSTTYTLTVTNSAGKSTARSATVTVVPAPSTPTITATNTASEGDRGLVAAVPDQAGCTFAWTIERGDFEGGGATATGTSVRFSAGSAGALRLSCIAKNSVNVSSEAGSQTVEIVALPSITSFTAEKSPVTSGTGTTLSSLFSGGMATIDQNLGAVVSGSPKGTGPLTTTTTYTLTVINAAGSKKTAIAVVEVVAPPTIGRFTAAKSPVTIGSGTTLTAEFSGGMAEIDLGLGPATSGTPVDTGNLSETATYTLTVTNVANTRVQKTVTVETVAAPVIRAFTASPASISEGAASQLAWDVEGAATLSLAPGLGDVTAATSLQVTPADTTTYSLTATNAAGTSVSAQTTVSVAVAPPLPPTVALATLVTAGKSGLQASTASQGPGRTYTWTLDNGTITGGQGTPTLTFTAGRRGALTVRVEVANTAGSASGSATATIVPAPSASIFGQDRVFHGTQGLQASVPIQTGMSILWTLSMPGGSITSGVETPVLTYASGVELGTYQLSVSVQNAAGDSASEARTLHVVGGEFLTDPTSPMVPRSSHAAVPLPDGRILVAGGWSSTQAPTHEDLFDPSTATWAPVAGMKDRRAEYAAVPLLNGKVLVAGGESRSGYLRTCELYDPATRTWSAAASMASARSGIVSALLPDGRVLVAGGWNGRCLSSAEIYDPTADRWSAAASLSTPRTAHQATLLPDGKVLITGGYDGSVSVATTEIYDPSADLWTVGSPMGSPRRSHTAVLLASGEVLVAGGEGYMGESLASTERYLVHANTWTNAGDLQSGRWGHSATVLLDGWVLVGGGVNNGNPLVTAEVFDPTANAWRVTGSMAKARWHHTASVLPDGSVLVVDGVEGFGSNATSIAGAETYNPITGTWSGSRSMVQARTMHTSTLLNDGRLLAVGGYSISGTALDSVESYDSSARAWTATASLAVGRKQHTATKLLDGRVLIVGGQGQSGPLASSEIFDPASNRWSSAGSLFLGRLEHTATLLKDGRVLIAGGNDGGTSVAASEIFDPSTLQWSLTGSLAIARKLHTATLLPSGKVLVAGGLHDLSSEANGHLAQSELYDPLTGTWSPGAPMALGRNQHQAVALEDGTVLVAGGSSPLLYTLQTEIYDPTRDRWSPAGNIVQPRIWHTLTRLPGGQVILVGGYGMGDTTQVERFNPATLSWSLAGHLSNMRYQHTAPVLADGAVMVLGGLPFQGQELWRD